MKRSTLISLAIILAMCSSPKQENIVKDSTNIQSQDTSVSNQPAIQEEQTTATPTLESKSFEDLPAQLQEFIVAVQDPAKLANYINTSLGCYMINEGPGVYPVVTEVKTVDDLNKSNEFMLFMNSPQLENGYYLNAKVGPCDSSIEGIFFVDASNDDNRILTETYKTYLSAKGDELTAEMKTKLETLDASLIWYGDVALPGKTGELNEFGFLLGLVGDKVCLAAIDTRGCGI